MLAFDELFEMSKRLSDAALTGESEGITKPLAALDNAVKQVGRSFSGSWLGYHSRVYYEGLEPAPPGANFSQEWGLRDLSYTSLGSRGGWYEHDPAAVKAFIYEAAGNPDLGQARDAAIKALATYDEAKAEIISILETELVDNPDPFLTKLKTDLEELEPLSTGAVAQHWAPKGQIIIPRLIDQNLCAQSRSPMDMMVQG